jgi:hypothetical protein
MIETCERSAERLRTKGIQHVSGSGEEDRRPDDQTWRGAKCGLAEIQSICTDDEFHNYRRMIGQSMGCMLLDVMNPIVEMYPDLKPARLD